MTEPIHEWDAAYVLGALSPEDRRIFETHLEECPECRASVGELAGMPALLARVPAPAIDPVVPLVEERATRASRNELAGTPLVEEQPKAASRNELMAPPFETRASRAPQGAWALNGAATLGSLARRVRRRRLVRRWSLAGASVLAAAAIAAAAVLPTALNAPAPAPTPGPTTSATTAPGTQLSLAQTTPSPLSATVSLTAKRWGTAIAMECSYDSHPGAYATTGSYALYVTDAAGQATRVASWSAWPGADIHASGAVALQKSQLRTVEIRDAATDAVLLSSSVG